MQLPNYGYRRYQNQDVSDDIGHGIGDQECVTIDSRTRLKRVPVVADGLGLEKACNQTTYGPDDDIYPNHIEDHMVTRSFEDTEIEQKYGQFKDG